MNTIKNIIVIGASAGGLKAVANLVSGLKSELNAAFFLVLHVSKESIVEVIIQHLSKHTYLTCRIPESGEKIQKNYLYVAPADRHMLIKNDSVIITDGARENHWRPSIDVLFRSAAASFDSMVIGIILTGMLDDGTSGMATIKRCGGTCIVQEPTDAEFPDMPNSVLNHVDVDYRVPTSDIGYILEDMLSKPLKPRHEVPHEIKLEAQIMERMSSSIEDLKEIGTHTVYTCPDCGGGLWEIKEGKNYRYRCYTGHSFSERVLNDIQSEAVEESIWVSIRMLEERRNLLRSMVHHNSENGKSLNGMKIQERADEMTVHINRLKEVLVSLNEKDII